MLAIGRALMTNPGLLFLDEASEVLAPLIAAEIWTLLREIRAAGIAAGIVDKNHRAVTAHADRAMRLAKGGWCSMARRNPSPRKRNYCASTWGCERPASSAGFGNPAYAIGNREPGRGSYSRRRSRAGRYAGAHGCGSRMTAASGGTVSASEQGRFIQGPASASSSPPLPMLLPPYRPASEFSTSR